MRHDLLLVRHAKSAWDDVSLADHDRPLAVRGEKALRGMREFLGRVEHPPDVVLCSSARRTVDTLHGFRAALPKQARIDVTDELYLASAHTLLTQLHGLDDKVRCAMLVGHNPGIEDLALFLVGSGDAGFARSSRRSSPPAPWWRSPSTVDGRSLAPTVPGSTPCSCHAARGRDIALLECER